MMDILSNQTIVLASASPRRQELLSKAGYKFTIQTADIEETYPDDLPTNEIAEYIAEQKALAVSSKVESKNTLIIAADTIVIHGNTILGKPKDEQEAFETLQQLSGKKHQVVTGVCLKTDTKIEKFSAITQVYFSKLLDDEIWYYLNNCEVLDKAGSYGIQDWIGLTKIDKIEGCYFNVMGLPMSLLYKKLNLLQS